MVRGVEATLATQALWRALFFTPQMRTRRMKMRYCFQFALMSCLISTTMSIDAPSAQADSDEANVEAAIDETAGDSKQSSARSAPVRLMSPDREATYRRCLPAVDDASIAQLWADPRLVLYSEYEM